MERKVDSLNDTRVQYHRYPRDGSFPRRRMKIEYRTDGTDGTVGTY